MEQNVMKKNKWILVPLFMTFGAMVEAQSLGDAFNQLKRAAETVRNASQLPQIPQLPQMPQVLQQAPQTGASAPKAQDSLERLLAGKTLPGQNDIENAQKLIEKIINKPMSDDCNDTKISAMMFLGSKDAITKKITYSQLDAPYESNFAKFLFLGPDRIVMVSDGGTKTASEYKLTSTSIQLINQDDWIKDGVNKDGKTVSPWTVCDNNSVVGKFVAFETSGGAAKARAEQAVKEFNDKRYSVYVSCNTQPNPYAHADLVANLMRAFAQSQQMFFSMMSNQMYARDCKMSGNVPFRNKELLDEKGRFVARSDGVAYISIPTGQYTSIGVVGRQ
jgi:hypothetical protein